MAPPFRAEGRLWRRIGARGASGALSVLRVASGAASVQGALVAPSPYETPPPRQWRLWRPSAPMCIEKNKKQMKMKNSD